MVYRGILNIFNNSLCYTVRPSVVCCCLVAQSCPALCDSMDYSAPGFPVLHCLLELAQTHIHWVWCHPTISSSVTPFSCPQSFPTSGSFPRSHLFASGGQSIGASPSASVLPTNIQGWFPLGLPVLISLLSWPGIKPSSPVLGARNLNHWTTRKVPIYLNNKHSLNF